MKIPFRHFFIAALVLQLMSAALPYVLSSSGSCAWAVDEMKCIVCGMDVSKYPHSRYVVVTSDGRRHTTCGVQCGLTLHLRLGNKWQSATATDLLSNRPFDAKEGFFVFKSSVITDMAPGFISFRLRKNAERFAVGFGGEVLSYEEALDRWKRELKWTSEGH